MDIEDEANHGFTLGEPGWEGLSLRYVAVEQKRRGFLENHPGSLFLHLMGAWMQDAIAANDTKDQKRLEDALGKLEKYFSLLDSHPYLLSLGAFDDMVTERIFEYLQEQIKNEQQS